MATVFLKTRGIIQVDILEKNKTIMGDYYVNLLESFNQL